MLSFHQNVELSICVVTECSCMIGFLVCRSMSRLVDVIKADIRKMWRLWWNSVDLYRCGLLKLDKVHVTLPAS